MSGSSSYPSCESENDGSSFVSSSNESSDDEQSDELTLLNGDEESDEDSKTFEAFIKLSMRLKERYKLREASVSLERCDKIWDTMQLLKKMQTDYTSDGSFMDEENEDDKGDEDEEPVQSITDSLNAESTESYNVTPYIKYQPVQGNGNNVLPNFCLSVKSQRKIYHCVTCGRQFSERRALRAHSSKIHGIIMPQTSSGVAKQASLGETRVTRSHTPLNVETRDSNENKISEHSGWTTGSKEEDDSSSKPYRCSRCSRCYKHKSSLVQHSVDVHGTDVTYEMGLRKRFPNVEQNVAASSYTIKPGKRKISQTDGEMGMNPFTVVNVRRRKVKNGPFSHPYVYECISCQKKYSSKKTLRVHALKNHNIMIARRPRSKSSSTSKSNTSPNRENTMKNARKTPFNETKETASSPRHTVTRAGPKSSKMPLSRPQRACKLNMTYSDYMQENYMDEYLPSDIHDPLSVKSLTKCILCKRSCVDIRGHLKDYHRIHSPDAVLPLSNGVSSFSENTAVVNNVTVVSPTMEKEETVSSSRDRKKRKPHYTMQYDKAYNHCVYQCNVCLYIYASKTGVDRHLKRYMTKSGEVRKHQPQKWIRRIRDITMSFEECNVTKDPSALSNSTDTSIMDQDDDPSDATVSEARVKQRDLSEDRSLQSSSPLPKRRKISDSNTFEYPNKDSESINDITRENNYEGTAMTFSEVDFHTNDEEEETKIVNSRDTRDSSDRDSGIGISITIKKRNNSYEVVEKEICDEDNKSKDSYEIAKNANVVEFGCPEFPLTTETTLANVVDYFNEEREAHGGREISVPLIRSVESDNTSTATTTMSVPRIEETGYDKDDAASDETRNGIFTDNEKANTLEWSDEYYNDVVCTNMPGKVPSLKVLCRNVLKTDERVPRLMSNDKFSHQCPVCCRFYPTERDVTVHMLTHKVN